MMCPTHPSIIPYDYALFLFSDVPNHKGEILILAISNLLN